MYTAKQVKIVKTFNGKPIVRKVVLYSILGCNLKIMAGSLEGAVKTSKTIFT